ncbi:MAG TPA: cysteine methyltransferase, partial [Mycobacterium sp.]|nr:cysteine methyltransferase [Mycobacterium sp.]
MTCQRIIDSPIGPLTLAGEDGKLSHLLMLDHSHAPNQTGWQRDDTAFPDVVEQLAAYF